MSLSAEARTALRRAITNHPAWDAHRKAHNLSLATMTRDDFFAVASALQIDVEKIRREAANTSNDPVRGERMPNDNYGLVGPSSVNAGLDPAQFPARGGTSTDERNRRAADDFATADEENAKEEDKGDVHDVPELPVALPAATLAKIDNILAVAVDPDISFSALYAVARRAIVCANGLKTELENGTAARDPHAKIVKSSLDFVAPSWSREFLDYLDIGATVAVVGPSGNGKTTGARKLLERAGWNVYEFDCTDATLPQDLIGRTSLRQEHGATVTEWTAGPIAKAFADPKGAVLLNEYDALDPRTGMALQSALEAGDGRRVSAPDTGDQLRSAGPCPIVLTLNTIGHGATVEYQGRNALDGANRDRVEMIVTGYENEAEILVAHGITAETARRVAEWAVTARARLEIIASREILSNRRLLTAAQLIDTRGMALSDAVQRAFIGRMAPGEAARFVG